MPRYPGREINDATTYQNFLPAKNKQHDIILIFFFFPHANISGPEMCAKMWSYVIFFKPEIQICNDVVVWVENHDSGAEFFYYWKILYPSNYFWLAMISTMFIIQWHWVLRL